jgi:hypothetical protein
MRQFDPAVTQCGAALALGTAGILKPDVACRMLFCLEMAILRSTLCVVLCLTGCGGSDSRSGANLAGGGSGTGNGATAAEVGSSCAANELLSGASYDITKSRFAFGSTPSKQVSGSFVRWVGSDGVVAVWSDGSELGIMNAVAPEANLPDWSTDASRLTAHVIAYWASMGLAACQIANPGIHESVSGGGSVEGGVTITIGPSTVSLGRAVRGIRVVESLAVARFNVNDQTTNEAFYWPEIPASVVSAAVTFATQLADPTGLAAYKAKLPADAQGQGQIVIHHTSAGSSSPFQSAITYDVVQSAPPIDAGGIVLGGSEDLSFDPNGNPVTTAW